MYECASVQFECGVGERVKSSLLPWFSQQCPCSAPQCLHSSQGSCGRPKSVTRSGPVCRRHADGNVHVDPVGPPALGMKACLPSAAGAATVLALVPG